MSQAKLLDGIVVVDATQVMAGPYCAMLLSDMGARVIKVEPPAGDSTRAMAGATGSDSPAFHAVNRGKLGIVLDLTQDAGRDVFRRLARTADIVLDVSVDREVCPHNLAPTNSALATLAMGDALAVALMRRRGFTSDDFARYHPGGTLGRRLLTRVKDVMRRSRLPVVAPSDTVGESLMTITEGRLGLVLVMNGERLLGLVTDGDLRRAMQREAGLLSLPVSAIMTRNPVTIEDLHATLYHALGIPPNHGYVVEKRPFYVTKDGKGKPVLDLLA